MRNASTALFQNLFSFSAFNHLLEGCQLIKHALQRGRPRKLEGRSWDYKLFPSLGGVTVFANAAFGELTSRSRYLNVGYQFKTVLMGSW